MNRTLRRLIAAMLATLLANVAFDDHPTDRRMAGRIGTTTVDSITAFLALREGKVTRFIERLPPVRGPNV